MSGIDTFLFLIVVLFTKHFYVDFPLQTPFQYLNKGTYGHPGGLQHSGYHALATLLIVSLVNPAWAIGIAIFDFVVHYHVDWAKVKLNKHYGWKPDTDKEFWWLLGLDQYLHALTYISIAYILVHV